MYSSLLIHRSFFTIMIHSDITSLSDLMEDSSWLNHEYMQAKFSLDTNDQCSHETTPDIPVFDGSITYDLCIFHAPCNDGTAAAYAVSLRFPECEFLGVNRGSGVDETWISSEIFDTRISGKNIVLVDYVYPKYTMMELIDCANHVLVIDHHVSEYQVLSDLGFSSHASNLVYSSDFSASILTWKFFHPTLPVPKLIQYINDSDVGDYRYMHTSSIVGGMAIQSPIVGPGLWSRGDEPFRNFHLAIKNGTLFLHSMILMGMIARQVEWRDIYTDAQRCAEKRLVKFPNFLCRVVNVSPGPRTGALVHALLSGSFTDPPCKPCDIAIFYYRIDINGSIKICFRSESNDVNVGEIAKNFGGGGHAQAASVTWYGPSIDDLFIQAEYEVEPILDKASRWEESETSWSSSTPIINGMRNGWKQSLSYEEVELLIREQNHHELGDKISDLLQSRGLVEIPNDVSWYGIGLLRSGRIVYYQEEDEKILIFEKRNQMTILDDPNDIWPLFEGPYMDYVFRDNANARYVLADSLEEVTNDERERKLVRFVWNSL